MLLSFCREAGSWWVVYCKPDKLSARVPVHKGHSIRIWEDHLHPSIHSFRPVAREGTEPTGHIFNCILFRGHPLQPVLVVLVLSFFLVPSLHRGSIDILRGS